MRSAKRCSASGSCAGSSTVGSDRANAARRVLHAYGVRPEQVVEVRGFADQRPFVPADLDDVWYVVAAAPPATNKDVLDAAEHRHVFVNAVDDPAHASAYAGSVVRRAGVTIAFSTDGRAPALAGLLREALDAWLPADLDTWMVASAAARREWKRSRVPMEERRPMLLETLNRLYEDKARDQLPISNSQLASGV